MTPARRPLNGRTVALLAVVALAMIGALVNRDRPSTSTGTATTSAPAAQARMKSVYASEYGAGWPYVPEYVNLICDPAATPRTSATLGGETISLVMGTAPSALEPHLRPGEDARAAALDLQARADALCTD